MSSCRWQSGVSIDELILTNHNYIICMGYFDILSYFNHLISVVCNAAARRSPMTVANLDAILVPEQVGVEWAHSFIDLPCARNISLVTWHDGKVGIIYYLI